MDPLVLTLVLTAAVLHASWNALVKSGGDPWVRLALAKGVGVVCAAVLLPFVEAPNAEAWPFILGSAAVHQVYFVCVALQYRFGDLSHVYPISRGTAPILVAAAAFIFADETLSPAGAAAVIVICAAIISLTFESRWRTGEGKGVFFALCTSVTIAVYTVIDGLGGRTADDVFAYIVYLFLIDGIPFGLLVIFMRRRVLGPSLTAHWKTGVIGGVLAFLAYGLVIWAMTLTPMTYISALRETSVILAALIGAIMLGEPFGRRRVTAAAAVAFGVVLLQFSQGS
ncbi:MAG: EamA family transporter [Rhodospirillaceae bacterium]|jgi:drug/metabolite transporter (DMT)-like permease|nr:EamA family transporter [Rhodospirillaceae bacterium]|tara:strand:+ start:98 stop:946 length:849 start_codon:yes stop_codon:yes gene_type:complete